MNRIDVNIDRLRRIANMAGAPTMHYDPEYERTEQRRNLDAIAAEVGMILREATVGTTCGPIIFGQSNCRCYRCRRAKGETI